MAIWEADLVPLAEPGSGMYHAAMDRVKGRHISYLPTGSCGLSLGA